MHVGDEIQKLRFIFECSDTKGEKNSLIDQKGTFDHDLNKSISMDIKIGKNCSYHRNSTKIIPRYETVYLLLLANKNS